LGQRWYPGETLSVSIGQGFVNVTPIELAVAVAAIANGGTVYQPMILKKIVHRASSKETELKPKALRQVAVKKEVFKQLRSFAREVVNNPRGTGKRARLENVEVEVGGKTGTAQVVSLGKESLAKEAQDHAWFVSFAPVENPTIAMAVVVENGGHGGVAAAPISKKIMEVFFAKRIKRDTKSLPKNRAKPPFEVGDV